VKYIVVVFFLLLSMNSQAQSVAHYNVLPGTLHQDGTVDVTVLPNKSSFDVEMDFDLRKKPLVLIPDKLLKGKKIYQFPLEFKNKKGYLELEKIKTMTMPKAELSFVKKGNLGKLKNAYFIQVLPINKKSKIDIVYHPSLSSVGWARIKITFLSHFPILNGYELEAEVDNFTKITGLSSVK